MRHYQRVMAEISLDALVFNYHSIKKHLQNDIQICGVIKADAYGHGAVPVAKILRDEGMEAFAVASTSEAVALRKNGIDVDILVLGYSDKEVYPDMINYNIIQTIFRWDMVKDLSETAIRLNKVARVHVKIDTGMGRLGFMPEEETVKLLKKISELPMIKIEGIFTHFATADEVDKTQSNKQMVIFRKFIKQVKSAGIEYKYLHISNSAGVINNLTYEHSMVRVGIALYGLYPSKDIRKSDMELEPVLTLKSNIILVKTVKAGSPISYGGTYVTSKQTKIATIPVGYGDGYSRRLSSLGRVLVRGKSAKIIGRICMDQFMIDVSDIENVCEGDEVILIGKMGDEVISVDELAKYMDTINYEVICQLGKRIPRLYIRGGKPVFSVDYF